MPLDLISCATRLFQRFEYTFEAVWKAAQLFLRELEGADAVSPKGVIRALFQVSVLTESQTRLAMEMVDDRNLTAHTYNENLAEAIYSRIPGYIKLLEEWLDGMERRAISVGGRPPAV